MAYHDTTLTTADGLELHLDVWLPDGPPKAVVVVVHGIVEHVGRYAETAEVLAGSGYAVCGLDLRGHGKSQGERVWIDRFDQYLDDLDQAVVYVRNEQPDTPVFLFGHSMGGLIVAALALERRPDVRGLVVSAAPLKLGPRAFPLLRKVAAAFSVLLPRWRVVRLGGSHLSRDPREVERFQDDPLVFHGRIPNRTGGEVIRVAADVCRRLPELELPLLVLHGTADVVTDPAGSRELAARAGSADKTIELYEGLYHALWHEPERDRVRSDLIRWLDERS